MPVSLSRHFRKGSTCRSWSCFPPVWFEHPELRGRIGHEMYMAVYKAFNTEGIEVPYPKRELGLVESVREAGFEIFELESYKIYAASAPASFPIRIIKAICPN